MKASILKRLLSASLSILLSLVVSSCKQTDDQKSGVVARIIAQDGNVSGAVAKLYLAPDVTADASVWSVTSRQTQVGFRYNVAVAFDHRMANPVLTDTANADGEIQFENVVAGNYVIVAEKPGHGWSVPREVSTTGGDIDLGELRLPNVITYGEFDYFIEENTTWRSGDHHVIYNNLNVEPGVTLTIEPGAVVLLRGNKSLKIEGNLICRGTPDNFIRFAAADVINRDPDEWQALKLENPDDIPDIAYVSFRDGSTALDLETSGGVVEYCYFFRFSGEGVLARFGPPIVRRCVFSRVGNGIRNAASTGILCENNVFQTCDPFAITLYNTTDGEVYCNWFRDCGGSDTSGSGTRGVIKLDLVRRTEFHNNFFETSWFAFQVGSHVDSTTEIHHNEFTRMNTVVNIGVTEDQRGPSNPKLNYNCFSTIDRFILDINCNQHNYRNVDATNNWWGTTSLNQIHERYIHDRQDDGTCPLAEISPIMTSCNEIQQQTGVRAGICQ